MTEVAGMRERRLGDLDGAAESYHQILDERPQDGEAFAALHRIYTGAARWEELLKLLERAEDAATDDERRADVLYQQGELLRGRLSRAEAAVEAYGRALEADVRHGGAVAALMEMAQKPATGLPATETLLPILRQLGDADRLCLVLERRGAWMADDPAQRAELLAEAGRVAEEALGDPARALADLGNAFRAEPRGDLVDEIERLAASLGAEKELAALYRERAGEVMDAELQLRLHLRLGELAKKVLIDPALAEASFRKALELDGESAEALEQLELMYGASGRWSDLNDILRRRADFATDDETRAGYLRRRAEVLDTRMGDAAGAIEALQGVLDIGPEDAEALTQLERLYRAQSRWADLKEVLARQLDVAAAGADRVAAHCRMADLLERHLHEPAEAMEHWTAAAEEDRRCEPALAALQRTLTDAGASAELRLAAADVLEPIAAARSDWTGLVQIAEIRLAATDDPEERRALLERIYSLYEETLEDLPAAFRALARLFEVDPEDADTRGRLFRLAALLDRWEELATLLSAWVDREIGASSTAVAVAAAVAFIYERHVRRPEVAARYYRHVLDDADYGPSALDAVERIYLDGGRWDELVDIYRDRADAALEPERRRDLLGKIARIQEEVRKDPVGAIAAYQAILEVDDNDAGARAALERLLKGAARWSELVEHYQRELSLAADDAAGDVARLALAEIYETRTGEPGAAIDLLEEVLRRDAGNAGAVAALERMLSLEEHRLRLIELLEPIYFAGGAWRKLVAALEGKLDYIEDPTERVDILTRVASLLEDHHAPADEIFHAYARAFAARYGDEELGAALERSAAARGAYGDLVRVYETGIDDVFDMGLKVEMLLRIARLQEKELRNRAEAVRRYRGVLEIEEGHAEALDALERLHGESGDDAQLVEVVERKAQGAFDDAARTALLARAAELRERLGQNTEAIAALRQVVDIDPHHPAVPSLERLLAVERQWSDLVAHLRAQSDAAADSEARRVLRHKTARVLEAELGDVREAIAELSAALDENPADVAALEALERLFRAEKMWPDLLEILNRRAAAPPPRPTAPRAIASWLPSPRCRPPSWRTSRAPSTSTGRFWKKSRAITVRSPRWSASCSDRSTAGRRRRCWCRAWRKPGSGGGWSRCSCWGWRCARTSTRSSPCWTASAKCARPRSVTPPAPSRRGAKRWPPVRTPSSGSCWRAPSGWRARWAASATCASASNAASPRSPTPKRSASRACAWRACTRTRPASATAPSSSCAWCWTPRTTRDRCWRRSTACAWRRNAGRTWARSWSGGSTWWARKRSAPTCACASPSSASGASTSPSAPSACTTRCWSDRPPTAAPSPRSKAWPSARSCATPSPASSSRSTSRRATRRAWPGCASCSWRWRRRPASA
jgi:tetratricopeptide (TPR) repeat protein